MRRVDGGVAKGQKKSITIQSTYDDLHSRVLCTSRGIQYPYVGTYTCSTASCICVTHKCTYAHGGAVPRSRTHVTHTHTQAQRRNRSYCLQRRVRPAKTSTPPPLGVGRTCTATALRHARDERTQFLRAPSEGRKMTRGCSALDFDVATASVRPAGALDEAHAVHEAVHI